MHSYLIVDPLPLPLPLKYRGGVGVGLGVGNENGERHDPHKILGISLILRFSPILGPIVPHHDLSFPPLE